MSDAERFWAKVERSDGCWLWHGASNQDGYGRFWDGTRMIPAHHFAYGPVPEALELDHLCRTPACVRPNHLEAVTHAENSRRGRAGAYLAVRETCANGHPFDDANTMRSSGHAGRQCRACRRERQDRYRRRRQTA